MISLRPARTPMKFNRRQFLHTSAGVVAATFLAPPGMADQTGISQVGNTASATPGIATQRIDGLAKVTGAKVYARDFSATDMGWDAADKQCYAMFLRALRTDMAFAGVDTAALPPAAQGATIILGDQLSQSLRSPQLSLSRDPHIDEKIIAAQKTENVEKITPAPEGFDRPDAVVFDLIVQPGNVPDYLGQAVALMIFDDFTSFRAAQGAMQFQDASYQIYETPTGPLPPQNVPFDPQTTYVKNTVNGADFSYAKNGYDDDYLAEAATNRSLIADQLASIPGLIQQDLSCDMRAMDPMFMEPEAGLAWIDPSDNTLRLVLGTQSPDGDVKDILSMFNDENDAPQKLSGIELTSCYPGGGFGGRDSSPFSLMLALASAFTGGRPVKLVYDRFEQFRVGLKRHAATVSGQVSVAPDMTLQNIEMTMQFDGGGRKNLSPYVASLAALCAGGAYKSPMANIYADAIHSENVSGGSQRGFGGPQAFFAVETALDDIARNQGWDPVTLRRANIAAEGDTTVVGGPIKQQLQLSNMLDVAEQHPLWANRAAIKADYAARGLTYGTGLAMSLQAYGTSGDGMIAAIRIQDDGSLCVQSDAVDMGNGSATTLGVVIGDILGANATRVDMGGYTLFGQSGMSDDRYDPQKWENPLWTAKSVGSSSACLTALHQVHVVQQTAIALMQMTVLPVARVLWDLPDLAYGSTLWSEGALVLLGGVKQPITWPEIIAEANALGLPTGTLGHAYFQDTWVEADFPVGTETPVRFALDGLSVYYGDTTVAMPRTNVAAPSSDTKRYSRYVWAPCVNVIGATVNTSTGTVQIENIVSVLNAGRIHVPELVSGQSQGGVAMAISYTLHEDMPPGMDGPANGKWNLNRYHVARYQDVPLATTYNGVSRAQELIVMPETPEDKAQGRGIAEAVMCSIPPAISNALADATGKRFTSLPITPAKIIEGLGQ